MLLPLEYLISGDLVTGLLLVFQVFGYIATILLEPVFFTSDISRYVLTHVSMHCVFLNVMSPSTHSKYILSQWRNHLLILSQVSAKVLFILGVSTKDNTFSYTTIYLTVCIPIVAEGLGVNTLFRYLTNVDGIGKLLI